MRNFQLAVDLLQDTSLVFQDWFNHTIVCAYGTKIPLTVEFLCKKLEIDDTQIKTIIKTMRSKNKISTQTKRRVELKPPAIKNRKRVKLEGAEE